MPNNSGMGITDAMGLAMAAPAFRAPAALNAGALAKAATGAPSAGRTSTATPTGRTGTGAPSAGRTSTATPTGRTGTGAPSAGRTSTATPTGRTGTAKKVQGTLIETSYGLHIPDLIITDGVGNSYSYNSEIGGLTTCSKTPKSDCTSNARLMFGAYDGTEMTGSSKKQVTKSLLEKKLP